MESLAAIILSGGFSRRMGTDKGLVSFKGKPMIEASLALANTITDNIMIIANNGDYRQFGYQVYGDILVDKGPMGGIHAGLTHSNATFNMVLACDMPLMTTAFLKYIVGEIEEGDKIIAPRHGQQIEPLCAVYHKDCLSLIESTLESSDLSLHGFIANNQTKFIDIDERKTYYSPYLFSNTNTLEDLRKLEKLQL